MVRRSNSSIGCGVATYANGLERTRHLVKTIQVCITACFVYFGIGPLVFWVKLIRHGSTGRGKVPTHWQCRHSRLVGSFVDCLDSVCIVRGELWVKGHLGVDVDTCVDQAKGVEMELDRVRAKVSRRDKVVLLIEEVGECWAIVTSIRFGPDGELVVIWLVLGETATMSV